MKRIVVLSVLAVVAATAVAPAAHAGRATLSVSPKRLNLGEVTLGLGSIPEPAFYTNTGAVPIWLEKPTFSDVRWFGSELLAEQPGMPGCGNGLQLDPGQTCSFGYTFNPQELGRATTTVTFGYMEVVPPFSQGTAKITLVGKGVAPTT